MNRQELIALGVGFVLILGVVGVANVSESVSITERPYESSEDASSQGATNVTIPVVEAMRTAQNETGGVAVETRLRQDDNASGTQRPVRTYEVNVLQSNGSVVVVDVDAANGTVFESRPAQNETDGWRGLFDNQTADETNAGNVTGSQQLDLDAIRSGPEAVELAREESGSERTVTEVELGSRNGTVVYNVRMVTEAGGRSTVVVAAYPDEGGVLGNETETETATG